MNDRNQDSSSELQVIEVADVLTVVLGTRAHLANSVALRDAIARFQQETGLPITGLADQRTLRALAERAAAMTGEEYVLEGRLADRQGTSVPCVELNVYRLGLGCEQLVASGASDERGYYQLAYQADNGTPIIQIRYRLGGVEYPLIDWTPQRRRRVVGDLVVLETIRPRIGEYQRLIAALPEDIDLAALREDDGRRDLTYLSETTGWSKQALDTLVRAARSSQASRVAIDVLYALGRMGIPIEPDLLARVDRTTIGDKLGRAIEIGIVDRDPDTIPSILEGLGRVVLSQIEAARAPGTVSTLGELLDIARLPAVSRAAVVQVYARYAESPELLAQLQQAVPEAVPALLRVGALASLTANSAPLAVALQKQLDGAPVARLVDHGFHEAAAWTAQLTQLAGGDDQKLAALIPPGYPGELPARVDAYARALARHARLAFPMRTLRARVVAGELASVGQDRDRVADILDKADVAGVVVGANSQFRLATYLREHGDELFANVAPAERARVEGKLRTLQRLHQITPSDAAMIALDRHGIRSARDVIERGRAAFSSTVGKDLPDGETDLVFSRAQTVTATVDVVMLEAKRLASLTGLAAVSEPREHIVARMEQARATAIGEYASLATLFGSLDFCPCEDCQSILGPAAYFVDLLHWLEQPDGTTPYEVLTKRRPDLPLLGLTCENTNVELPYIDIVNEILEFLVVNGDLDVATATVKTVSAGPPFEVQLEHADRWPDGWFDGATIGAPPIAKVTSDTNGTLAITPAIPGLAAGQQLELHVAKTFVHDVDPSVTSEDLIAEPRNVLLAAYEDLKLPKLATSGSSWPRGLPFDVDRARVRALLDRLDVPWHELLEALRPTSDPAWTLAIAHESLELGGAELAPYINGTPAEWWRLYGYTDLAAGTTDLALGSGTVSAAALARRLGTTDAELVELVQTAFVNPELQALAYLRKVDLDIHVVLQWKRNELPPDKRTELEAYLGEQDKRYPGLRSALDATPAGAFEPIVVLFDTRDKGVCSFDGVTLGRVDGAQIEWVLYRINILVRLWRALGWSLDVLDPVMFAFGPELVDGTAGDPGAVLARALANMAYLDQLHVALSAPRDALLALWGDIPTRGSQPLYERLFLHGFDRTPFESLTGAYLTSKPPLSTFRSEVQGGLRIAAADIASIAGSSVVAVVTAVHGATLDLTTSAGAPLPKLGDGFVEYGSLARKVVAQTAAGLTLEAPIPGLVTGSLVTVRTDDDVQLTLELLARLYRHALLARSLDLSIRELIALVELSGIDPFVEPVAASPIAVADLQRTLAFVALVRTLRDHGFAVADLDYLARHRFDPLGARRDADAVPAELILDLVQELARIDVAFPVAGELTSDVLRGKLVPAFPAAVVDELVAMWSGTREYVAPLATLSAGDRVALGGESRITIEDTATGVLVRYRGVVTTAIHDRLAAAYPFATAAFDVLARQPTAFLDAAFPGMLDGVRDTFFPEVLDPGTLGKRRDAASVFFKPLVFAALTRSAIVRVLSTRLGRTAEEIDRLVGAPSLASDPLVAEPLLNAFTAVTGDRGLSIRCFDVQQAVVGELLGKLERDPLDRTGATRLVVPALPAATVRIELRASFALSAAGVLRVAVQLDAPGATATISVGALQAKVSAGPPVEQPVELAAGVLHELVIAIVPAGGGFSVALVGDAATPDLVSAAQPLPGAVVERIRRAHVLLAKLAELGSALALDADELVLLISSPTLLDGAPPLTLPLDAGVEPAAATAAVTRIVQMARYVELRSALRGDARAVRRLATAATTDELSAALYALAPQEYKTGRRLIAYLAITAPPTLSELRRLDTAMRLIRRLGVDVEDALDWVTDVDVTSTTIDVTPDVSRAVRDAIRRRFTAAQWRTFARPIFDQLRRRQRDALVAYVVAVRGLRSELDLYDELLLDPGTEPVVLTSRLQLAIASVQTFVQRIFLNLEPDAPPSKLVDKEWAWRQRYRVWEANRKIFLYPENFLEPELRTDATHLYSALAGTLLQGDITTDLVETAFHDYLHGLEEIARLQIVSFYREESSKLHVLARTHADPARYFYRSRDTTDGWSPWTPVQANITGTHVAIAPWRDRPHVFWITITDAPEEGAPNDEKLSTLFDEQPSKQKPPKRIQLQLGWVEYFQDNWVDARAAGPFAPIGVSDDFDPGTVRIFVAPPFAGALGYSDPERTRSAISLLLTQNPVNSSPAFGSLEPFATLILRSKHATVEQISGGGTAVTPFIVGFTDQEFRPNGVAGTGALVARVPASNGLTPPEPILAQLPATAGGPKQSNASVIPPSTDIGNDLYAPFFFQDGERVFYVDSSPGETKQLPGTEQPPKIKWHDYPWPRVSDLGPLGPDPAPETPELPRGVVFPINLGQVVG